MLSHHGPPQQVMAGELGRARPATAPEDERGPGLRALAGWYSGLPWPSPEPRPPLAAAVVAGSFADAQQAAICMTPPMRWYEPDPAGTAATEQRYRRWRAVMT
jgi:hypothetical protein